MTYGQSVTDACLSWAHTVETLDKLRAGVVARRKLLGDSKNSLVNRVLNVVNGNGVGNEGEVKDFNDAGMFDA